MLTQLKLTSIQTALPDVQPEAPTVETSEPQVDEVPAPEAALSEVPEAGRKTQSHFGAGFLIGAAFLLVFWFFNTSALRYFSVSRETYGLFWPRREWLLAHVIGGSLALFVGLVQFWPTLRQKRQWIHRTLGVIYIVSTFMSGVSAFYLAYHTDFGWMFGAGMAAMGSASMISTGLATIAILRRMVDQHREWMVRSYVVTFGFVVMRLSIVLLEQQGVGTVTERLSFASWVCWSVPLFLVEMVIQGRKVCAIARKSAPRGEETAVAVGRS